MPRTYAHTHAFTRTCPCVSTHVHMFACVHAHVHVHVCMCVTKINSKAVLSLFFFSFTFLFYVYNQHSHHYIWLTSFLSLLIPIWTHISFVLITPTSYTPPTPTESFDRLCVGHHLLVCISLFRPTPCWISLNLPYSGTVPYSQNQTGSLPSAPSSQVLQEADRKDTFALHFFLVEPLLVLTPTCTFGKCLWSLFSLSCFCSHPLILIFYLHGNDAQLHGQLFSRDMSPHSSR